MKMFLGTAMNKTFTIVRSKYALTRLEELYISVSESASLRGLCVIIVLIFLQGCTKKVEQVHIVHGDDGILGVISNNGNCWRDREVESFYCPNLPNIDIEIKITCKFRKESPVLRPKKRVGDYWIWFSAPCMYSDEEISIINSRSGNSHGWGDFRGFRGGKDLKQNK
jgi:hypothetical protein